MLRVLFKLAVIGSALGLASFSPIQEKAGNKADDAVISYDTSRLRPYNSENHKFVPAISYASFGGKMDKSDEMLLLRSIEDIVTKQDNPIPVLRALAYAIEKKGEENMNEHDYRVIIEIERRILEILEAHAELRSRHELEPAAAQ